MAAGASGDDLFHDAVLDVLGTAVPYDSACMVTVDPATLIPTQATIRDLDHPDGVRIWAEVEYGEPAVGGFAYRTLATDPVGVGSLRRTTNPAGNPYFQRLLDPAGLHDEVRMVFRCPDGTCWGHAALTSEPGREFLDDDIEVLAHSLDIVAAGIRTTLLRQVQASAGDAAHGPAVVIAAADGEVESISPQATSYLEEVHQHFIGDSGANAVLMPPRMLALRLRRDGEHQARARVRRPGGGWLLLHAGYLDRPDADARIVVSIEPARPPEVVTLVAAALGLTPRESEILEQVLAGRDTVSVGRRLFISPHTVQDHLKNIFDKAGVHSRGELAGLVFSPQYEPAPQPPPANGW